MILMCVNLMLTFASIILAHTLSFAFPQVLYLHSCWTLKALTGMTGFPLVSLTTTTDRERYRESTESTNSRVMMGGERETFKSAEPSLITLVILR